MNGYDELELELRRLPGVRSAGFAERDDMLFVQVHAAKQGSDSGLALQATRLASRFSDVPVAVELVRWRDGTLGPAPDHEALADVDAGHADERAVDLTSVDAQVGRERRVRLLAVLSLAGTDEVEVHLLLDEERTIGRATGSRGVVAAAEATIDALRAFVPELAFAPVWTRDVVQPSEHDHLVAVGLSDGSASRHGIAGGETELEAAARATLAALNRTVAPLLPLAS